VKFLLYYTPMSADRVQRTSWATTPLNTVRMPDATVMVGGPVGQDLPEHAHDFVQLSTVFRSAESSYGQGGQERFPDWFTRPDTLKLTPAKMPHRGGWNTGTEIVVAHLENGFIQAIADEFGMADRPDFQGYETVLDPLVLSLLKAAGSELRAPIWPSRWYMESLVHSLAGRLVMSFSDPARRLSRHLPHLGPLQMRRIDEVIEFSLDRDLSLPDLAKTAGMGTQRFMQAIRNTTGKSLHQYVMARRIARAKRLLAQRNPALAEISFQLGFSSQSHFGAVFKRLTGFTPKAYREAQRR